MLNSDYTSIPTEPGFHPGSTWPDLSGEALLWCGVVVQALRDLRDERPPIRAAAREYLESDSQENGSLIWICDQLGINADLVRRHAAEIAAQPRRVPGWQQLHHAGASRLRVKTCVVGSGPQL